MPQTSALSPRRVLVGIEDAAAYLGRNVRFVRRLVEHRKVVHYKPGGVLRFDVRDLDDYLDSCRVDAHR